MDDLLCGCWMTYEVSDGRSGMSMAANEARAALRGWDDAKVRRVHAYMVRLTRLWSTYEGAKLIDTRLRRTYYHRKLSQVQLTAILVLRSVANGDLELARVRREQLKIELLRPDAQKEASRRRQVKEWSKLGVAARENVHGDAERNRWVQLADAIAASLTKRKPSVRELARRIACETDNPKAESSIRKYLGKMMKNRG